MEWEDVGALAMSKDEETDQILKECEKCPLKLSTYCLTGCAVHTFDDYEDEEEHGCLGYGSDYAPGSEQCEWCADRESCANGGDA